MVSKGECIIHYWLFRLGEIHLAVLQLMVLEAHSSRVRFHINGTMYTLRILTLNNCAINWDGIQQWNSFPHLTTLENVAWLLVL